MKKSYKSIKIISAILLAILLFSSCRDYKNLALIREVGNDSIQTSHRYNHRGEYKFISGDRIAIYVNTGNDILNDIYNGGSYTPGKGSSGLQLSGRGFPTYDVDFNGNIQLPVIGEVPAEGLNSIELEQILYKIYKSITNSVFLVVRSMNYQISILGEVKTKGILENYSNQLNILQAIAMADGIRDFGNPEKVLVIRNQNNSLSYRRIDLTSASVFQSEYFILLPNDIVYIEPIPQKSRQLNTVEFRRVLQLFTTTLTTLVLVTTLL